MKKISATVAVKEEYFQRTLTSNEEFHAKQLEAQKLQLEEYSEKMKLLLNEFMKNKEAQAHQEEVLSQQIREKEEKMSLLLAQVQELEAQSTIHLPIHPAHNLANPIQHPLEEPLSENR